MGHTHTAIAGHVRAAHALRRIAAAALLRKTSRELVLAARAPALDAREPSLAAFARLRSLHASQRSLRALASARFMRAIARCARLPALDPASHRSLREASTLGVALVARELALAAREAPHACARQCALWRSSLAAHTRLLVPCSRPRPFAHCTQPTTQGRAAALCSCTMALLIAFVPHGRRAPLLVVTCPHYTTPLKGNT